MSTHDPNRLREGLGDHLPREGTLPFGGLTLHELGELIRRAGRASGFIVESEFKVDGTKGVRNRLKIDWVWLDPRNTSVPIAAFEIEGMGVGNFPESLTQDETKFRACGAALRLITLFQVDHDRRRKPCAHNALERIEAVLTLPGVRVLLDADLMAQGGIEGIQEQALAVTNERFGLSGRAPRRQLP